MSANNAIFISVKTFKVYHCGCYDNGFDPKKDELIGKGKSLKGAIKIAQKFEENLNDHGSYVEYGIHFFLRRYI
jgi:hypothetical protein